MKKKTISMEMIYFCFIHIASMFDAILRQFHERHIVFESFQTLSKHIESNQMVDCGQIVWRMGELHVVQKVNKVNA